MNQLKENRLKKILESDDRIALDLYLESAPTSLIIAEMDDLRTPDTLYIEQLDIKTATPEQLRVWAGEALLLIHTLEQKLEKIFELSRTASIR